MLAKIFLLVNYIYWSRTKQRDQGYPCMFGKNFSREMVIKSIGEKEFPQRERRAYNLRKVKLKGKTKSPRNVHIYIVN